MRLDGDQVEDKAKGVFPEIAWTRLSPSGKAFYSSLGHRPEVWRDARFQQHILAGIRWAAGANQGHTSLNSLGTDRP
jgi:hypothetical protein